jgi:hypothetical protein
MDTDLFTLPACTPMTHDELVARFPAGASTWQPPGRFEVAMRSRPCNPYTGCGAWEQSSISLRQSGDVPGLGEGTMHQLPTSGDTSLEVRYGGAVNMYFAAPEPNALEPTTVRWYCSAVEPGKSANELSCRADLEIKSNWPVTGLFDDPIVGSVWQGQGSRIEFKSIICKDGRYRFVTKLAPEISAGIPLDGADNRNQIAIYGTL